MNQSPIITALLAHVTDECKAINVEERFDAMLDDSGTVNVAGLDLWPSRVWRECDPTAHRCGVADFSDSEPITEVDGSYYEDDELDAAKQAFVEEKEAELATASNELDELESEAAADADAAAIDEARKVVDRLQAELAELEAHSF